MAPGPTPVPPEVLAAGAAPIIHHRGPDFRELMLRTLGRLQQVCRTENDVLLFTASGSGAFESAIVNLLSPGERVLVVTAGEFGDRWCRMAAAFGADVHELRYAWGETPQPDDLRSRLDETGAEVVIVVHSETSTGVVADVQALARVAREAGALVVVDAVSSLGAVPLETDAWGLDVVVAGSQKALMTPPGLSLATVSEAAWERARRSTMPRFYFDWERTRAALEGGSTPFTPAVTVVASLDVALGLLLEEGLDAAFARHAALGRACREGAKAMGLELFSPDEERSAIVTAILTPDGVEREGARPRASRPLRDHRRRGTRRARDAHVPDRAHRLLRRARHHDGAHGSRGAPRRARSVDRARRGDRASARGVPRRRACLSDLASSSASRSQTRASSS